MTNKIIFLLSLFVFPALIYGQTENQIHPAQVGAYGGAAGAFLRLQTTTANGAEWVALATVATDLGTAITLGGDLTGSPANAQIASGAVGSTEIANGSIALADLAFTPLTAVTTNATLTGNGTAGTPLAIAQQGATSGQVLKWNGSAWLPATDAGTTYTAGTGIDITGTTISNTGDLSNTNELQTISAATNIVTLSGGGGTVTIAGAGINTVATASNTITVTGTEVDGSTTNEIQTVSRNVATNNIVTLSLSGGTVNVEDLFVEGTATFTAGQTTATMSGTLPAENAKLWVFRNGIRYLVGAAGCSGCNVTRSGSTLTFSRSLATGEVITFKHPLQ